jgi:hypothetical protein
MTMATYKIGDLVSAKCEIEMFPFFIVPEGALGVVTDATQHVWIAFAEGEAMLEPEDAPDYLEVLKSEAYIASATELGAQYAD